MALKGEPGISDNDSTRAHLRAGQTVCPYAHGAERAGRLRHLPLALDPLFSPQDIEKVQAGLTSLAEDSSVEGVFLRLPPAETHVQALRDANRAFFLARWCALVGLDADLGTFEDRNYAYLHLPWAQLESSENFIRVPGFEDKLFAFAMNPLYDRRHPRYMPHPVVVLTRWSDIVSSREEQPRLVQGIINQAMRAVVEIAQDSGLEVAQAKKEYAMDFYILGPTEWPKNDLGQPHRPVNTAKYFNSYWE